MKIYLIRHAQSEENLLDISVPISVREYNEILTKSHVTPLTPYGEKQAHQLGERLKPSSIQRLYTSPYPRAVSTATILGQHLSLTPEIIEDAFEVQPVLLKEHDQKLALRWHYFQSYTRMLWLFGGEENWIAHYRRAKRVWKKLSQEPVPEVALVSHAWFIGLILFSLTRDRSWRILKRDFSNCGVSLVEKR